MRFKTLLPFFAAICLVQAISIPVTLYERAGTATTAGVSTCDSDACADTCLNKGQVGICIKQKCQCQNVLNVSTMSQNGTKTAGSAKAKPSKAASTSKDDEEDDDEDDADD